MRKLIYFVKLITKYNIMKRKLKKLQNRADMLAISEILEDARDD